MNKYTPKTQWICDICPSDMPEHMKINPDYVPSDLRVKLKTKKLRIIKINKLLKKELEIIELLKTQGPISAKILSRFLDIGTDATRDYLKRLVKKNIATCEKRETIARGRSCMYYWIIS